MDRKQERAFEEFIAESGDSLLRLATLLTSDKGPPRAAHRVDTVGKAKVETFENPRTGATLESAWVEPSGELLEDLYQSITYTNHIPANPYQS